MLEKCKDAVQFETYTSFLEAVGTMRFISSLPTRAKRTRGLPWTLGGAVVVKSTSREAYLTTSCTD